MINLLELLLAISFTWLFWLIIDMLLEPKEEPKDGEQVHNGS